MKICIPSKGRASEMKTPLFFKPSEVLIFAEPQEVKRYKIFWPDYTIVDIKKSDQGIVYVRNFIIDYVKEDKILMIDDDANYIGVRNKDNRYDKINNFEEFLNTVETGLDKYWAYGIPFDCYAFFTNKNTNQQRFFVNKECLVACFGCNIKKIKENNIKYDTTISEGEDLDFTAQILLKNGSICTDYRYSSNFDMRTPGGLTSIRKISNFSQDLSIRQGVEKMVEKYGAEFIRINRDKNGYLKSYRVSLRLLLKRKEIAIKNF